MFAATHGLVAEGVAISPERLIAGMLLGLLGILVGKKLIDSKSPTQIASLSQIDARNAFLIISVMTAHSFAEGVACPSSRYQGLS